MNHADLVKDPTVLYMKSMLAQNIGSLVMHHVETDRVAYRQHLKTLENNLLKQGKTEEEYRKESQKQKERVDKANGELNNLAQRSVNLAHEMNQLKALQTNHKTAKTSYEERINQVQAEIQRLLSARGGYLGSTPVL